MPFHDSLSHLTIRPGQANAVLIPLLPDSSYERDPNQSAMDLATARIAPVNYTQQHVVPKLSFRAYGFSTWLTKAFMDQCFTRWPQFPLGQLEVPSLGPIRWNLAGRTPVQYAGCKLASIQFTWLNGQPLLAEGTFWAFGGRTAAASVGSPLPPVGAAYPSHRTVVTPGFGFVMGGSLRIDNQLFVRRMTRAAPYPLFDDSIDGARYARDLGTGCVAAQSSLLQRSDGVALDTGYDTDQMGFTIQFSNPQNTVKVAFTLNGMPPIHTEPITGGMAKVTRRYQGVQRFPDSNVLTITGT